MAFLTAHWLIDLAIFLVSLILAAYLYMTRNFHYWKNLGVAEITPTPFVGNFADCLLYRQSPGEFLKKLYDAYPDEPYVGFYIFDKPCLLVRDLEIVKHVLVRDWNYVPDRVVSALDPLGKKNIFFLKGPGWKIIRTKLTPIFTSGKLKKMFELMLQVGKDLETFLNSLHIDGGGRDVDMKDITANYATDVIGVTAFGIKVDSLNNPNTEFREKGRKIFDVTFWRGMQFMSFFFAPQFIRPLNFKFLSKDIADFLRGVFWGSAAERERTGQRREDLVDRLTDLKKNAANSPESKIFEFDGDNLVAQAGSFFVAGFETVSTTVSFALYELAIAPELQTRLRREIKETLADNNGAITYEMVTKLPYLDMVLAETLRKYPALPFLDRQTIADYKVPNSDLVIKKGTPIYIPMLGLHHNPEYFPDPEVFDPERFTEENKKGRHPMCYIPFGEGPRICIGARFGLLETKLACVHFLSEYEVLPCEKTVIPMKIDPKGILTAAENGQVHLKLRKLQPDADF